MATYAVGDVQGCYDELRALLDELQFDPAKDCLWSCGDLVNRGPKSLKTLRFCKSLGDSFVGVLGNHDLHLLSVSRGHRSPRSNDTFQKLLRASDRDELLDWLRGLPLFHYDAKKNVAMAHAGVAPQWGLKKCQQLSDEVSAVLQSADCDKYLANMYGNKPARWDDSLSGPARWRVITNYFTRMRFCAPDGTLELLAKAGPETAPQGFSPWYEQPCKVLEKTTLVFGHWAALMGRTSNPKALALDTGCAWGSRLTACRIAPGFPRTSVPSQMKSGNGKSR